MVLNFMKIFIRLFIFILLVFCFSCEKIGLYLVNCPDCTADEPTNAELDIRLDLNEFALTDINIYEGLLEDSILYASFRSGTISTTYQVPLNKKFTVTAKYHIGGNIYIAVDSAFPRVKYDKVSCQDPCYYIYDKALNLGLKYAK